MQNPVKSALALEAKDFGNLFRDYYGKVYRVILRLVEDPSDAEELTQETFLKVQAHITELRRPESFSSWVYRIAANTALDFLRRSSIPGRRELAQVSLEERKGNVSVSSSPESSLDKAESISCVRQYADQLPEQYRLVLVLHDLEGMSMAEVADVMGSSLGATKVRLHRARKRFAEICSAECEQFFDDEGILSCQPKPAVPLVSVDANCCDSDPGNCSCA
jgi:RNA polymerase sigma-70 factor (ECF subfamily)